MSCPMSCISIRIIIRFYYIFELVLCQTHRWSRYRQARTDSPRKLEGRNEIVFSLIVLTGRVIQETACRHLWEPWEMTTLTLSVIYNSWHFSLIGRVVYKLRDNRKANNDASLRMIYVLGLVCVGFLGSVWKARHSWNWVNWVKMAQDIRVTIVTIILLSVHSL